MESVLFFCLGSEIIELPSEATGCPKVCFDSVENKDFLVLSCVFLVIPSRFS